MTKTITLLLLYLLTAATAFSQTYTLELAKQGLPELQRNFYIARVVDSRIAKTSVGEVQRGPLNNRMPAIFAKPLEQELLEFIAAYHPGQENQVPLILRVNKLWISENTTLSSETGAAELKVDFIYQQDSVYHKLFSAAAVSTRKGLDVTKKHELNIANVLTDCLQQFAAKDFDQLLARSEKLTAQQLLAPYNFTTSPPDYPILKATTLTAGIYMTLDEFRDNQPGITSGYEIKQRSGFDKTMVGGGDVMPVLLTTEGKKKALKDAWGFAEGNTVFINYNGSYYAMGLTEEGFTFLGPPNPSNTSGAVVAGAVSGGAIGGAIAGGLVAATAQPVRYTLDLETGSIHIQGRPAGMSGEAAKLILYLEAKAARAEPVYVTVNGESKRLDSNQWIELDVVLPNAGTAVCVAGEQENCLSFMASPGKSYYIACSLSSKSKSGKASLTQVDSAKGEFDVKGIKFAQIKEAKKSKKENK